MEENNKMIDFLRRHGIKLLIGVALLSAGGIFFDRLLSSRHSSAREDFTLMHQVFERMGKGEPPSLESLQLAEKALKKHPELRPHYEALMTLCYFNQEQREKGIACLESVLKKCESISPSPYQLFGKTTITIAQGHLPEALDQARALETTLREDPSLETLRCFNLLRMAFLAKNLHQTDFALKQWQIAQDLPSYAQIAPFYEQEAFKLKDYFNF